MNQDDSAVVAAWLSVVINFVTLIVTLAAVAVGSIALLSVDGVRWMLCRNTGYECGFQSIRDDLLTLDVDPAPGQTPSGPPPPGVVTSGAEIQTETSVPDSAWDLLVAEVKPSSYDDLLDPSATPAEAQCLSFDSLATEWNQARAQRDAVYGLIGSNWRWKVNYLRGPVDEGVIPPGSDAHPRSLVFEIDANYAQLPKPVDLSVHLIIYPLGIFGMSAPTSTEDFVVTLPSKSWGITMFCPISDLPVGQYSLLVQTNGLVGDWQDNDMSPLSLTVNAYNKPRETIGIDPP